MPRSFFFYAFPVLLLAGGCMAGAPDGEDPGWDGEGAADGWFGFGGSDEPNTCTASVSPDEIVYCTSAAIFNDQSELSACVVGGGGRACIVDGYHCSATRGPNEGQNPPRRDPFNLSDLHACLCNPEDDCTREQYTWPGSTDEARRRCPTTVDLVRFVDCDGYAVAPNAAAISDCLRNGGGAACLVDDSRYCWNEPFDRDALDWRGHNWLSCHLGRIYDCLCNTGSEACLDDCEYLGLTPSLGW
jgi:hypothetical protein